MAAKRKGRTPPSASAPSHSSDEDSPLIAQPNPSHAKNPKLTKRDDDGSDSDSGSESESESESDQAPPTKTVTATQKPSKSEESSDEEEDEKAEEEEKPKSPAKEPKSQPDTKKLKLSAPAQSPPKKSVPAFQRIWSPDDELALLRALSKHHVRHGKLPPPNNYASFFSSVKGSIGFPVTEKQLSNKIRQMRYDYGQDKKKKGSAANISEPHKRVVFTMCAELFEDSSTTLKKKLSLKAKSDAVTETGGTSNGGGFNSGAGMRPCVYLGGLIEDLINRKQLSGPFFSVEDVVEKIGISKAQDLEKKVKELRIDANRFQSMENKLMAELFTTLADEMGDA